MNSVDADHFQFAFTIMFHYLFPVLTMGLGVLIAVLKTMQALNAGRAGQAGAEVYGAAARFWAKSLPLRLLSVW